MGNVLLGLPSSGPHSNGYSLIRRIIEVSRSELGEPFGNSTLGETLLTPTKIYVKTLQHLSAKVQINALAHITGGGLLENIPRVLPENAQAQLTINSWERPSIFNWLKEKGNVKEAEMLRTFNCGIGMVACIDRNDVGQALALLAKAGEEALVIGEIGERREEAEPVTFS